MAINVMKRYELKYLLDPAQTAFLKERLKGQMEPDEYGRTTIASLYYDTPSRQLIRTSLEKPEFKEKIRLRSYGPAGPESPVYLELKRKAFGIVYKRRIETRIPLAENFFAGAAGNLCSCGQIDRELAAFRDHYQTLEPSCLIIYDRTAYCEKDGDLRLTIDENPRYRTERLTLEGPMDGKLLLDPGWTILEVKVQEAVPLWLAAILSEGKIAKSSFSKYGEAYCREMLQKKEKTLGSRVLQKSA